MKLVTKGGIMGAGKTFLLKKIKGRIASRMVGLLKSPAPKLKSTNCISP